MTGPLQNVCKFLSGSFRPGTLPIGPSDSTPYEAGRQLAPFCRWEKWASEAYVTCCMPHPSWCRPGSWMFKISRSAMGPSPWNLPQNTLKGSNKIKHWFCSSRLLVSHLAALSSSACSSFLSVFLLSTKFFNSILCTPPEVIDWTILMICNTNPRK